MPPKKKTVVEKEEESEEEKKEETESESEDDDDDEEDEKEVVTSIFPKKKTTKPRQIYQKGGVSNFTPHYKPRFHPQGQGQRRRFETGSTKLKVMVEVPEEHVLAVINFIHGLNSR
jgi:hypothetical protein